MDKKENKKNNNKKHCNIEMHSSVTVWSKGQVVIPKTVRDHLSIQPWDSLVTLTQWNTAIGFVKSDNLPELINYLKQQLPNDSA